MNNDFAINNQATQHEALASSVEENFSRSNYSNGAYKGKVQNFKKKK